MKSVVQTIVVMFVNLVVCESAITQCHEAYECSLQSITSQGDIECNGYHSCAKAIEISSNSDTQINCYGSFSCYKAKIIQFINPPNDTISNTILCMYTVYVYINLVELHG